MRKERNPIAWAKAHKSFPVPVLQGLRMYLKIMKGGVSTKRTDKAINVVFWIGFVASMVLCLAAWVFVYLHQVLHWSGAIGGEMIFDLIATTLTAVIFLFMYLCYYRKQRRN